MYLTLLYIVCYGFTNAFSFERNNVCKTVKDYYIKDISPYCWHNPDVTANATELITRHGYPVETYKAITEDFYILTIFRIPPKYNESRGVVFLQHPATSSATVFIDLGKQSLAFLLADYGYDVWMGNFRGTLYSLQHVYLSYETDSYKYWNFSFHEMGLYDTPAMFEVAMKITGYKEKMYYIGHSLATTTAFVFASSLPVSAANYIKLFILWSPLANIQHIKGPIKVLSPLAGLLMPLATLTDHTGTNYNDSIHKVIEKFCIPWNIELCADVIQFFVGPDPSHFSPERFPIMLYQNLAGFPVKGWSHYAQIYNFNGSFQWYDYGRAKNEYYYNSERPPLYPIEDINVPMYFVYGGNDYLAVEEDVLHLYHKIRDTIRYGIQKVSVFNHVDFNYAQGIEHLLYKPTLEVIEGMRNEETTS